VQSAGVIVEGNSFLDFVEADFAITCARAGENRMKTSARRTLEKADAIYLSTIDACNAATARARFDEWRRGLSIDLTFDRLPVLTKADISELVIRLQAICEKSICSRLKALSADGTSALPAV
jgi:hypothetical protein